MQPAVLYLRRSRYAPWRNYKYYSLFLQAQSGMGGNQGKNGESAHSFQGPGVRLEPVWFSENRAGGPFFRIISRLTRGGVDRP
jgi:hypothetical protein